MSDRTSAVESLETDEQYNELEAAIASAIQPGPLFQTDADPDTLWHAYLDNIREDRRQHYNCHCCRNFIQRVGGLVTIDETGRQRSAIWEFSPPGFFLRSVESLHSLVQMAKVTGVFISSDRTGSQSASGHRPTAYGWPEGG